MAAYTADADKRDLVSMSMELQTLVALDCTDHDIINLRLTCRHLAAVLQDSFTERFLSKRIHYISQQSLQGLLDISLHPLGKRVKEIELAGLELDGDWMPNSSSKTGSDPFQRSIAAKNKLASKKLWEAWCWEVRKLHDHDNSVNMLANAFRKFKEFGTTLSVSVAQDMYGKAWEYADIIKILNLCPGRGRLPYVIKDNFGQKHAQGRATGFSKRPECGQRLPRDPAYLLLSVTAASNLAVRHLRFAFVINATEPPGSWVGNNSLGRSIKNVMAYVKTFEFSVTEDVTRWWHNCGKYTQLLRV